MTKESIDPKSQEEEVDKAAYVCPSCRMIFSLPLNLGGNGATCPGCDHLLTIPKRDDGVSALGVSTTKYDKAKVNLKAHQAVKQHRVLEQGEHHEWADSNHEHSDKGLKLMIPIAAISLLLIGGLAYLLLSDNPDTRRTIVNTELVDDADEDGEVVAEGDGGEVEEIYVYNTKDKKQVADLEEFLTGLFGAKSVDELLPYARPVENIKEKMVKHYKGEAITQSPFKSLEFAVNAADLPHYLSFRSQTKDYNNHYGVLQYKQDQILLDWESFVAYSDMNWAELAEKKPTESVRIRVTAKRAFYYNEEFTDEAKWQAVSLISPNEEDPIYGYVEKGSATSHLLFNFGNSDNRKVVLDVYFPENAKKGNQVFIESVVTNGWIVEEEK